MNLEGLQVYCSELTTAQARIRARLTAPSAAGLRLDGHVTGPRSRYARTLPSKLALCNIPASNELAAEGVLPDPCFWTPETPLIYDVDVSLIDRSGTRAVGHQMLGLRPLTTAGRRFRMAGHNWVLRGVHTSAHRDFDPQAWHELNAVLVARQPTDQLCQQASEIGVLIMAELDGADGAVAAQLRRLSRWPAVGFAVLDDDIAVGVEIQCAAPQIVLIQRLRPGVSTPDPWAQAVLVEAATPDKFLDIAAALSIPVLAERHGARMMTLEAGRQSCDNLQRKLAEAATRVFRVEVAGYVV